MTLIVNNNPILANGSVLMRHSEVVRASGAIPVTLRIVPGDGTVAMTLDLAGGDFSVNIVALRPGDNYTATWSVTLATGQNVRLIVDATRVSELATGALYRVLWSAFNE